MAARSRFAATAEVGRWFSTTTIGEKLDEAGAENKAVRAARSAAPTPSYCPWNWPSEESAGEVKMASVVQNGRTEEKVTANGISPFARAAGAPR